MKDEKFCFKKSTGFIALVGILLVGFVLFAQMSNTTTTSTNTKAAGTTCQAQGGKWYLKNTYTDCSGVAAAYDPSGLTSFTLVGSPSDAETHESYVCCVAGRRPTTDPTAKTCSMQGGKWYSDADCDAVATRFKTPFVDSASAPSDAAMYSGKVCCVPERQPTTDPTAKTCSMQGGKWYSDASCAAVEARFKTPFTDATTPSDATMYTGKVCCIPGRMPTVDPTAKTTCASVSGKWYDTATYTDCDTLSKKAGTMYVDAPASVTETRTGKFCCVTTKSKCNQAAVLKVGADFYKPTGKVLGSNTCEGVKLPSEPSTSFVGCAAMKDVILDISGTTYTFAGTLTAGSGSLKFCD